MQRASIQNESRLAGLTRQELRPPICRRSRSVPSRCNKGTERRRAVDSEPDTSSPSVDCIRTCDGVSVASDRSLRSGDRRDSFRADTAGSWNSFPLRRRPAASDFDRERFPGCCCSRSQTSSVRSMSALSRDSSWVSLPLVSVSKSMAGIYGSGR